MLLKVAPLSVLICHWTVGVGKPLAAAVSVTDWPSGDDLADRLRRHDRRLPDPDVEEDARHPRSRRPRR